MDMDRPEQPKIENPMVPASKVDDLYVNSVGFTVSIYEFLLQFGVRTTPDKSVAPVVNIRMSPQHAKVMARLFMRQVRAYEQEIGPIYLPAKLIEELHLEDTETR